MTEENKGIGGSIVSKLEFTVYCYSCHNYHSLHALYGGYESPLTLAIRQFKSIGWGKCFGEWHCPQCSSKNEVLHTEETVL